MTISLRLTAGAAKVQERGFPDALRLKLVLMKPLNNGAAVLNYGHAYHHPQKAALEGLQETLTALRTAFPDMRWHVQEQIAEDNRVLTRFIWEGTQRGNFLGIPPTHRSVSVWGMVIDEFDGPKVKSTRILMDTMGLMQQLGALPGGPL